MTKSQLPSIFEKLADLGLSDLEINFYFISQEMYATAVALLQENTMFGSAHLITPNKTSTITIPKEEIRYKPRQKLKATKAHKDKKKYTRKVKHK